MSTTTTVTVLFTDVVGSTQLRTGRGEAPAHRDLQAHSDVVRQQVEAHSGRVVKTAGDDFMVAFDSARRAVECAVGIQRTLAEQNRRHPDREVHIRIGINTGEAIVEGEDLFGAAVNAAKRIEAKAVGDQILVSEIVRGVVGAHKDVEFVDRGRVRLKGFPERWRLYEVPWQAKPPQPTPLVLSFLFTDVVGSFDITERLGDDQWLDILRAHNAIVRAELAAHEASWFKSLGDGFMVAFPAAIDALECAISIQRDFAEYNEEHPDEPLSVRVGLHTGNGKGRDPGSSHNQSGAGPRHTGLATA
ncbi:MAG: adenylate/guanylate cyclase domain-containing protein [Chloroflexi bacterium]|nr:MAG: adenylate/guanylate cyclase domain-containing protein [Chloroflexota bacterium]